MPRVFAKSWNQPPAASHVRCLDFAQTLRAGNKWPAVLVRAAPMTPGKAPMKAGVPPAEQPPRGSEVEKCDTVFFEFS